MATEEKKPLMIRGDCLLLALEVLDFYIHCDHYGGKTEMIRKFVEPDPGENPRRCSFTRTRRVFKQRAYTGILLAIGFTSHDAALALLRSITPRTELSRIHVDAHALFPPMVCIDGEPGGSNEHPLVIRKRAIRPLLAFLRAIASGELIEADFVAKGDQQKEVT